MTRRGPSRRAFFRVAAGAGAAAMIHAGDAAAVPAPDALGRTAPRTGAPGDGPAIKLGVASYSLRTLTRARAIAAIKALATPFVNIKSFHLPYDSTPAALAAGRAAFEDAGLRIVGGGTITLDKDDDDDIRSYFEYAKAAGMPLMVVAPTRTTLPRLEPFVQEYDIAVAVHNHGPEDPHFPGPQDVLPHLAGMDPRVGVCLDAGHTARTGIDVVEAIYLAGDRLLDIHMKDLADLAIRDSQCIVGEGKMPVAAMFRALAELRYDGYVNLEYEIDADDPLPGMQRSFAFMRGVLAALGGEGARSGSSPDDAGHGPAT